MFIAVMIWNRLYAVTIDVDRDITCVAPEQQVIKLTCRVHSH